MLPDVTFPWEGSVLVGFSGGPDSRLLLHLLAEERERTGRAVYAAHVNHGIRGDEADRDEAFCVAVAKKYGIPLFVERLDVPSLSAASGRSLELEARLCRYRFFEKLMAEHDIPLLATAHNADDQLETVLLRLLRGTGTKGLGGIPKTRALPGGGLVVRPLLEQTKADILSACEQFGLQYVTDRTNLEDDCTRNRIRHRILPELEQIAGVGIPQRAAVRLAESMLEDEAYLLSAANTLSMEISVLRSAAPAVAKRAIRETYAAFCADHGVDTESGEHSLSAVHLNTLLTLCRDGEPHSRLDLPCGVQAVIENGMLCFGFPKAVTPLALDRPVPLRPGSNPWDGGRIVIDLDVIDLPCPPPDGEEVFASATLPLTEETQTLYARYREEGDVIRCHGMTKKLKKILCDKKISIAHRGRLPLICLDEAGHEPLWFPGAAFRDGFAAPKDGPALRITVRMPSDT